MTGVARVRVLPPTRSDVDGQPPLAERLWLLRGPRAAAVLLVLLGALLAPDAFAPWPLDAVQVTLGYAALAGATELAVRRRRVTRAAGVAVGSLLGVDVLWLAATAYQTGSLDSPVCALVLMHVGVVALRAGARTTSVVGLAHAVVLTAMVVAQQGSAPVLPPTSVSAHTGQRLAVLLALVVAVSLGASVLAGVHARELRRRADDLDDLTGMAEALERAVDTNDVAQSLLDLVVDSTGATRGAVLAAPEGQLPVLASYGLEPETARQPGRPGRSSLVERAHEVPATLLVVELDPHTDPWLAALMPGARGLLVVPIAAEARPLGALVLELGDAVEDLEAHVVPGLERFASCAALALRNSWLLEQVRRLAATDGLTKIANRRTFESTLEREMARAARSAEPLSLVMLDIDHFKALNDDHGHQAGDEVLRNVAFALACQCRDFDTAARYGGEEFAVVLPGCGAQEAADIAERLRQSVAAAPSVIPLTASAGVATFPEHAADADSLVQAADVALYQSKRTGRDRTTASTGVQPQAEVEALLRQAVLERLGRRADGTPPAP